MPKASAKVLAARRSQAIKCGETLPLPEANDDLDPSVLPDPTYWPGTSDSESNVQRGESMPPGNQTHETSTGFDLVRKRSFRSEIWVDLSGKPAKQKQRRENADILPERTTKVSRTTAWRNERGKPKGQSRGHAAILQREVLSAVDFVNG